VSIVVKLENARNCKCMSVALNVLKFIIRPRVKMREKVAVSNST
jgi:hypothetical protein